MFIGYAFWGHQLFDLRTPTVLLRTPAIPTEDTIGSHCYQVLLCCLRSKYEKHKRQQYKTMHGSRSLATWGVQTGHREQHTVTYKLTKQLHKIQTLRNWKAKLILPQLTCLAYVAGCGHRACVSHWTGITVAWIGYRQEHRGCKHIHNMYA